MQLPFNKFTLEKARTITQKLSEVPHSEKLTSAQLKTIIKGLPYENLILGILKKRKIIQKKGKFYEFCSQEPVYYKVIAAELEAFKKSKKLQVRKDLTIEDMISLLKKEGYKILKPITNYEEL